MTYINLSIKHLPAYTTYLTEIPTLLGRVDSSFILRSWYISACMNGKMKRSYPVLWQTPLHPRIVPLRTFKVSGSRRPRTKLTNVRKSVRGRLTDNNYPSIAKLQTQQMGTQYWSLRDVWKYVLYNSMCVLLFCSFEAFFTRQHSFDSVKKEKKIQVMRCREAATLRRHHLFKSEDYKTKVNDTNFWQIMKRCT